MQVLVEVYRGARALWPLSKDAEGHTVTIEIGGLKESVLDDINYRASTMLRRVLFFFPQRHLCPGYSK